MPFVVCAKCGEKAELPANAPSAAASETRCAKCQLDELLELNAAAPPDAPRPSQPQARAADAPPAQGAAPRQSSDELNWELPSEVESGDVVAAAPASPLETPAHSDAPQAAAHDAASDAAPTLALPHAPLVPAEPVIPEAAPLAQISSSDAPPSDTLPSAYSVDPALRAVSEPALAAGAARSTLPFGPAPGAARQSAPHGETTATARDRDAADATLDFTSSTHPSQRADAPSTARAGAAPARPRSASADALGATAQSDAPVVHSWSPPAGAGRLRRYAPAGVALAAVALAFIAGMKVGRMTSPSAAAPAASPAPAAETAAHETRAVPPTRAPVSPASSALATPQSAASARTAAANASAVAPPTRAPRFNPKVAQGALSVAAARAKACKKPGTPAATAIAAVEFAPSGNVENVRVSGARVAGTETASCIAEALARAHVPAFSGKPQTIKQIVKLK